MGEDKIKLGAAKPAATDASLHNAEMLKMLEMVHAMIDNLTKMEESKAKAELAKQDQPMDAELAAQFVGIKKAALLRSGAPRHTMADGQRQHVVFLRSELINYLKGL